MYPEYDCLSSLAAHFKTQLHAFLSDQAALALRQKSPSPDTATPSRALFTFSGQFSTVSGTPTHDLTHPTLGKPVVLRHISSVRTELERVSHFRLYPQNPREPVVAFKQGFAMRFACLHSIPLELFVSGSELGKDLPTTLLGAAEGAEAGVKVDVEGAMKRIKKDIKGELDVIAAVDDSHCVLPGQMTVVRFRMGVVDAL
jgi:hypothetical protein